MFRNTILPTCRRVFTPSCGTISLVVAWGCWWVFILVGGAILMAQDNPTRESDGVAVGQPKLEYLDAIYFLEVAVSSCGLGDIVPVTDGGRAIIFIWSFVGTGIWGVVIGGLVIKLTNWIYVSILMASYYDIKKRKKANKAATEMKTPRGTRAGRDGDSKDSNGDNNGDLEKADKKEKQEEEDAAAGHLDPLEARVLPWYTLVFLNGLGLVIWFSIHLTYAGVLYEVEDSIGNLGDLTPNNYGNVFYFSIVASQTICFGTDYNPKTSMGRAWWLIWHQIAMMANTFLFITVTLAILKYVDTKTFWLVGRVVGKVKKRSVSDSESESESDSD